MVLVPEQELESSRSSSLWEPSQEDRLEVTESCLKLFGYWHHSPCACGGRAWPSQAAVLSGRCVLIVPSSSSKDAAVSRSWQLAACLHMKEWIQCLWLGILMGCQTSASYRVKGVRFEGTDCECA